MDTRNGGDGPVGERPASSRNGAAFCTVTSECYSACQSQTANGNVTSSATAPAFARSIT